MKPKTLSVEIYTITQAARLLGYKSTKTLYRLLNKGVLDDYLIESTSGRLFLNLNPAGFIPLKEKIKRNIQKRLHNVITTKQSDQQLS